MSDPSLKLGWAEAGNAKRLQLHYVYSPCYYFVNGWMYPCKSNIIQRPLLRNWFTHPTHGPSGMERTQYCFASMFLRVYLFCFASWSQRESISPDKYVLMFSSNANGGKQKKAPGGLTDVPRAFRRFLFFWSFPFAVPYWLLLSPGLPLRAPSIVGTHMKTKEYLQKKGNQKKLQMVHISTTRSSARFGLPWVKITYGPQMFLSMSPLFGRASFWVPIFDPRPYEASCKR